MQKRIVTVISLMILSACANGNGAYESDGSYPKSREELEIEKIGKLTGEDGIIISGGDKKRSSATDGINVNSYLWRAALDVVHKMPLLSADPFGGTILTDWHHKGNDKERFKMSVFIIGGELRSDAVKVSVFKQVLKNGRWVDGDVSNQLATQIEDKILISARNAKYSGVK